VIPLFTPQQVRLFDERTIAAGTPSLALMERAAGHLARAVLATGRRRYGLKVLVLCGKGNNGGDGLAAARRLLAAGCDARVHLVGGDSGLSDDATEQLRRLRAVGGRQMRRLAMDQADVVVDCLLGTGSSGDLREPIASVVVQLNAERRVRPGLRVVACDLPTGVDADTGEVAGEAVRADTTVTLGAGKRGLWLWPARAHCGDIRVADIGITDDEDMPAAEVLEHRDAAAVLAPFAPDVDKRGRGVVMIVAGSAGMAGAAIMAARGALAMGAGLLTVATSAAVRDAVAPTVPEALTVGFDDDDPDAAFEQIAKRLDGVDALAVGPGMGHEPASVALVRRLVADAGARLVLDADGLNAFRGDGDALAEREARDLVCTPHAREYARLLGSDPDDVWPTRVDGARQAARRWDATIVVKGPGTVVAAPDRTWVNATGDAALATGGSGDVLTGMLAAVLAGGRRDHDVAATVHVHGLAGELAGRRLTPRAVSALDIAAAVPRALQEIAA